MVTTGFCKLSRSSSKNPSRVQSWGWHRIAPVICRGWSASTNNCQCMPMMLLDLSQPLIILTRQHWWLPCHALLQWAWWSCKNSILSSLRDSRQMPLSHFSAYLRLLTCQLPSWHHSCSTCGHVGWDSEAMPCWHTGMWIWPLRRARGRSMHWRRDARERVQLSDVIQHQIN